MKNIELKILGLGYKKHDQARVQVYDNNCLIEEKNTYNGKVTFCLESNKFYKIIIFYRGMRKKCCIYTKQSRYSINLCNFYNKERVITFLLTDYNYFNLPIMKGELYFG